MLGIKNEIESYAPIDVLALEGLNGGLEDSVRDSINHYNKAIELIKGKSEDIAILEIKRALTLNPHFTEAQNLLGLLYAFTGEEQKAVEVFKGVMAAEKNSIKALDYIGKIDGMSAASSLVFTDYDSTAPKKNETRKKSKPVTNTVTVTNTASAKPVPNAVNSNKSFIENYIVSVKYHIIAYAVLFALGAVIFHGSGTAAVKTGTDSNDTAITDLNNSVKDLTDKNKALTDENANLKNQINKNTAEVQKQADKSQLTDKLNEADTLAQSRKYEQSADLLLLLKDAGFTGADLDKYNKLMADIIPKATWSVYLDGMNFYNSQDYKNAATRLAKSLSYGGKWDYTADSWYNLGRSYQAIGDKQNALNAYNNLKANYPSSSLAADADNRIAELNK